MTSYINNNQFKKDCLDLIKKRSEKKLFEKKRGIVKNKHYAHVLRITNLLILDHAYFYNTAQKEMTKGFIKKLIENIQPLIKK